MKRRKKTRGNEIGGNGMGHIRRKCDKRKGNET